jgi:hypothetical protein
VATPVSRAAPPHPAGHAGAQPHRLEAAHARRQARGCDIGRAAAGALPRPPRPRPRPPADDEWETF